MYGIMARRELSEKASTDEKTCLQSVEAISLTAVHELYRY